MPETFKLRSRDFYAPAAIFVLALIARVLFFLQIRDDPVFNVLEFDAREYFHWARRIAGGESLSANVFFTSPLYAYFLAAVFWIFGDTLQTVRIAQMVLGSFIPVFLYLITKRPFGFACAVLAGTLAAIYAPFIYYDMLALKTTLEIFLLSLGFWLLFCARDKKSAALWLAAGIAWGLAAATKENCLLFVPFICLWIVLKDGKSGIRKALIPLFIFTAGLALPIIPITAHNALAGKDFVLVGYAGGANFYQGNFRGSDGINRQPDFIRADPRHEEKDWIYETERLAGRKLKASEISKFWFREGAGEIAADPFFFLKNTLKKLGLVFNRAEPADNYPPDFFFNFSRLLKHAFLKAWPVITLGLFGFFLAFYRGGPLSSPGGSVGDPVCFKRDFGSTNIHRNDRNILAAFIIVYSATLIFFHVSSRYRLPVIWALIPFAAWGIVFAIDIIRRREWSKDRIIIYVFVACVALPALPLHSFTAFDASDEWNSLGQVELDGRYDEAAGYYQNAIKIWPENQKAQINLIEVLLMTGRTGEAADELGEAIVRFPGVDRYYILFGIARREKDAGKNELLRAMKDAYAREGISREGISGDADSDFRFLMRDGRNKLGAKNFTAAIESFGGALKLRPDSATVNFLVAECHARSGSAAEAAKHYRRAAQIEPYFLAASYNLAMQDLKKGNNEEALAELEKIAAVVNGYAETEKYIGYVLEKRRAKARL